MWKGGSEVARLGSAAPCRRADSFEPSAPGPCRAAGVSDLTAGVGFPCAVRVRILDLVVFGR